MVLINKKLPLISVEKLSVNKRRIVVNFFITVAESLIHSFNLVQKFAPKYVKIIQNISSIALYLFTSIILTALSLLILGMTHYAFREDSFIELLGQNVLKLVIVMVMFAGLEKAFVMFCESCVDHPGYHKFSLIYIRVSNYLNRINWNIHNAVTDGLIFMRNNVIKFYRNVAWDVLNLINIEDNERINKLNEYSYDHNIPKELSNIISSYIVDSDLSSFVDKKYDINNTEILKKYENLRPVDIFKMYFNPTDM